MENRKLKLYRIFTSIGLLASAIGIVILATNGAIKLSNWLVPLHIHADSNSSVRTYNASGTEQLNTHMVYGSATLAAGTVTITLSGNAAFTSSSTYKCTVTDSVLNLTAVTYTSGAQFTILGVLTDTVSYHCVGN